MRAPLLWEWLVCIGILLCLAGIFLPISACGCSKYSPATHCISNAKQIATSLQMYAVDNNDILPHRDRWMDVSQPYLKRDEAMHDPLLKEKDQYGYAFDSRLSDAVSEKVEKPEAHPLIFDSVNLARNASDPFISLPSPARHDKKNSVGYLDGHAKWVRTP